METTRRDALLGMAAAVAVASPKFVDEAEAAVGPSPASVSDDPLVALGRRWEAAYAQWIGGFPDPANASREEIKEHEDQRDVLLRAACQLEDQAAEIPAQSLAGVLVQLRMAGTHYHLTGRDGEEWYDPYAKLTWQAWNGLERLAGEA